MHNALPYKTKQFFFVLIKLSIVFGAFYFIYNKLVNNKTLDFDIFMRFLNENDVFSSKNITFLMILTVFNWFFEITKWRILISSIKKITFKNALEQSLGSLTASLFTPNRIGEYGAKAAYFSKAQRKRVLLINLIGNMLQMSVTVILGCIGFYMFKKTYALEIDYFRISRVFIILFVVLGFVIFGLKQKRFKLKGFSSERIIEFVKKLALKTKILGFLLSVIRYAIFSFQFYFLLTIFNVDLSYLDAMIVITSTYFLASILPSLSIFDVVIKGSVAIYLFGIVGVNELTILSVIMLMWLLNFVIPSIFGSYYVLNFNFIKDD